MVNDIAKELLDIKTEIENRKTKRSELDGALKSQFQSLKEDFNCTTIEEAKQYLAELSEERDELKLKIEIGIEEVKKQLGGLDD
jgi:hypothetical protein